MPALRSGTRLVGINVSQDYACNVLPLPFLAYRGRSKRARSRHERRCALHGGSFFLWSSDFAFDRPNCTQRCCTFLSCYPSQNPTVLHRSKWYHDTARGGVSASVRFGRNGWLQLFPHQRWRASVHRISPETANTSVIVGHVVKWMVWS